MSFRVIFTGSLRDGFNRRRGIESLGKQFALGFDQIKYLLSGAHRVVKCVEDRRQAERIVKALWDGGWHTELHLDNRVVFRTNQVQKPSFQDPGLGLVGPSLVRVRGRDSPVSAVIPESWQPCTDLNPNAVLQVGDRNAHHYMIVLMQAREELPAGLALPDYSVAQLQQCLARLASGRLLSGPEMVEHGDSPACTSEISARLDTTAIQYLVAHFQCERYFHTLFLWCSQREFPQQKPLFQRMVAGFRTEPVVQAAREGTGCG